VTVQQLEVKLLSEAKLHEEVWSDTPFVGRIHVLLFLMTFLG